MIVRDPKGFSKKVSLVPVVDTVRFADRAIGPQVAVFVYRFNDNKLPNGAPVPGGYASRTALQAFVSECKAKGRTAFFHDGFITAHDPPYGRR